ncbi:hypothetical protein HanRHA438_Chr13g0584781 [Helianthus annuus]|nr:hypothetical protein HanIR_Chr13g0624701 [Helianthus annuus]KAJ0848041.1 hypothetical protein HanPSC8_Chr13g0552501 [Helianthus annuus]KAJ0856981.1 hypothetical protein HanRHA438_Chr13g0584781 [Helianthus annuus]
MPASQRLFKYSRTTRTCKASPDPCMGSTKGPPETPLFFDHCYTTPTPDCILHYLDT